MSSAPLSGVDMSLSLLLVILLWIVVTVVVAGIFGYRLGRLNESTIDNPEVD
jgi:hypothetical protein